LSAQDENELMALKLLRETIGLHIESHVKAGTDKEMLTKAGYKESKVYYKCKTTHHMIHFIQDISKANKNLIRAGSKDLIQDGDKELCKDG